MSNNYEKWEKKDGCGCKQCREAKDVKCPEKEKKEKCYQCKGKQNTFEFQSDERNYPKEIDYKPTVALRVTFDKICANDKVWLSGIVGVNNNTTFNDADLLLTIVRSVGDYDDIIYYQRYEVDLSAFDVFNDRTTIPFAHVEKESNEKRDVTYTVYVQRVDSSDINLQGPRTLTALRIS